jgi:hypothetical protein
MLIGIISAFFARSQNCRSFCSIAFLTDFGQAKRKKACMSLAADIILD